VIVLTNVPPDTEIVAVLLEVEILFDAIAVKLPLLLPFEALIVNHAASSTIDQEILLVTVTGELVPPLEVNEIALGLILSVDAAPAWVTVTVLIMEFPETVIVADLLEVKALAVEVAVKFPLPDPLDTLKVSHVASSFVVQEILPVTEIVCVPPVSVYDRLEGPTNKLAVAPVWVMLTILLKIPPVNVMDAILIEVALCTVEVADSIAFELPVEVFNEIQAGTPLADQFKLLVTVIFTIEPEDGYVIVEGLIFKTGVAPA